ncbi:MAG: hypothetical protein NVS3B2_07850 [Ramlibacter sp.]
MGAGSGPVSLLNQLPGASVADAAGGGSGRAGVTTPGCGESGTAAQPASVPTIAINQRIRFMLLILLEALLAMVLLIAIVWWTMFSGRKGGEPPVHARDGSGKEEPPNS